MFCYLSFQEWINFFSFYLQQSNVSMFFFFVFVCLFACLFVCLFVFLRNMFELLHFQSSIRSTSYFFLNGKYLKWEILKFIQKSDFEREKIVVCAVAFILMLIFSLFICLFVCLFILFVCLFFVFTFKIRCVIGFLEIQYNKLYWISRKNWGFMYNSSIDWVSDGNKLVNKQTDKHTNCVMVACAVIMIMFM